MTKLSKNFTLEEFTRSETATKLNIDNSVPEKYMDNLKCLVNNLLQPIRDEWGAPLKVTSGYRCAKLNYAVGGASNSDHVYACAADIDGGSKVINRQLFSTIMSLQKLGKIKFRQLIWEKGDKTGPSWIHISINSDYNSFKDNQILSLK